MMGNIFIFYTLYFNSFVCRPQTIKRPLNPLASGHGELFICTVIFQPVNFG